MATGAGDPYWEQPGLPSVFKHDLLRRYLPRFAGKTGSRARGVVYLDGYAGRGRYADGSPASAELILRIARDQRRLGISYQLFFHEPDPDSFKVLADVVGQYVRDGVQARAEPSEVLSGLDEVIQAANGLPLFLFLDPCGLGIPFSVLAGALAGPRASKWPPTEVLLNFSLEAVRRIGGHVSSATPSEKGMARLDAALDGPWWRELMRGGVTGQAVDAVVAGFVDRLGRAARMKVFAIPVRSAPSRKPVYCLVFGTRSPLGIWHFSDDTARATSTWWNEMSARERAKDEAIGQLDLFGAEPLSMGPRIEDVEARARPQIAQNLAGLAARIGTYRVGNYPSEILGEYLGQVREIVVRAAIKDLHAAGRTASDGKGGRPADLTVSPPPG
jgi:three-Cys-motif partner protein